MKPRFTIITPCFNAAAYIEETALSVLDQTAVLAGVADLEYLVCDGGSTDGTLDRLRALDHPALQIFSEPDRGMYDALGKGLRRATGQYVAYLNAGDYYHKCAFEVVADLFARYPDVRWLTGFNTIYNEHSQVVMVTLPSRFRPAFFENGFYGGDTAAGVQQESTFWRAELLALLDYDRLAAFRLAGDFYLWQRFATRHELHIVGAQLGGFKRHPGQQSEADEAYAREVLPLTRPVRPFERSLARWDNLVCKFASPGIKRRLHPQAHFVYDLVARRWCRFPERTAE